MQRTEAVCTALPHASFRFLFSAQGIVYFTPTPASIAVASYRSATVRLDRSKGGICLPSIEDVEEPGCHARLLAVHQKLHLSSVFRAALHSIQHPGLYPVI